MANNAQAKRTCPTSDDAAAASDAADASVAYVDKAVAQAVTSMGDKCKTNFASAMGNALEQFNASMGEAVQETKQELFARLEKVEQRVGNVEDKCDVIQSNQSDQADDIKRLYERAETLEKQFVMANQQHVSREDVESTQFDRPPNKEIIKINAHRYVTKASVLVAVEPWLRGAGISSDQFTLVGHAPAGKRFTIKFPYNPLIAARLAHDALQALKDEDENWKEFYATLANGTKERIHIGGDENYRSRTMRRMAAVFKKACADLYPHVEQVHFRFYAEAVYADKLGLCKFEPTSKTITHEDFRWDYENLEELAMEKAPLLAKTLKLLERPEENTQWRL